MLSTQVDEVDVLVERIRRLIENGSQDDPELGAGLGTTETLGNVQRKLDQAAAACEKLDGHVRDLARTR